MIMLQIVPNDSVIADLIASANEMGMASGFTATKKAFDFATTQIKRMWSDAVGPDHKIQLQKHSPFSTTIFSRDPMVNWLENGLAPYDMKTTHPFGQKSRLVKPRKTKGGKSIMSWMQKGKDGVPYQVNAGDAYLIVPMRHRMDKSNKARAGQVGLNQIYSQLAEMQRIGQFERSEVTVPQSRSMKKEPNIFGQQIRRAEYKWGSRLKLPDIPELEDLQGLVSMKGGSYMTFRVISVNSPQGSWMNPGIKERKYLHNILSKNQEKMSMIMDMAIKKDLSIS